MTQMDLFQTATSSQQDTHASHFHLPGSAEAQKMTDISGHTFFPLLKPSDPLGAFSRMFMGMSLWASTRCYLTWKGKATPQGRTLFQLVPQTHLTDETESGSSDEMWPTPLAQEAKHGTVTEWEMTTDHAATKNSLRVQVAKAMWPTPTVQDSNKATKKWRDDHQNNLTAAVFNPEKLWPTPSAPNAKGAVQDRFYGSETYRHNLDEAVRTHKYDGQLNPQWVEWLMGYPEGWTDLED